MCVLSTSVGSTSMEGRNNNYECTMREKFMSEKNSATSQLYEKKELSITDFAHMHYLPKNHKKFLSKGKARWINTNAKHNNMKDACDTKHKKI